MNNLNEMFAPFFPQTQNMAGPFVEANKLAAANFEKVVAFQFKTMQKYTDLSLEAMKEAAEIDSPDALQTYVTKQTQAAGTVRQEMMDDFKSLAEMSTDIREDLTKLAETNGEKIKSAAAKTAKKAG